MSGRTRVLLVDDHAVLTGALRKLLGRLPDLECVGEAQDGRAAVRIASIARPDVVVMDVAMPGMDGVEATTQILQSAPSTRVVILSGACDADDTQRALDAGAATVVHKTEGTDRLLAAIRAVRSSRRDWDRQQGDPQPPLSLSRRERQVLGFLRQGATAKEIAAEMGVSPRTVETYRRRIKGKLGARTTAQAGVLAALEGIIQPEPSNQ